MEPYKKSMKWAILGAIFIPLAAYIYVYPKGRKGRGALRGIGMSAAVYVAALPSRATNLVSNADLETLAGLLGLVALAIAGFIIWDIYRLVKKYNKPVALTS
jgi:hypothetical protein